MIAFDALVRLCPPPADPPPAVGWAQAERALGTALPDDYKQLVEKYGDGILDETIWPSLPAAGHGVVRPLAYAEDVDRRGGSKANLGPDARPLELN